MKLQCILVRWITIVRPVSRGNNNFNNNRRNVNCNNRFDNRLEMAQVRGQAKMADFMKTYSNLYDRLCGTDNLLLAFRKASIRKTTRNYVIDFEDDFENNILQLQKDLITQTYQPAPLTTFIVRDPKTRKINAASFRDRVVHHALCNIIGPIFETRFIHDSFANQKGKGTHRAVKRFEKFMAQNKGGYVLKADVRHYFDSVNHQKLFEIIEERIADRKVMWLIRRIITSFYAEEVNNGMPIGNLTSQFFANVFLDQLDQYVKHTLKAERYIRYVDDFVLIHKNRQQLEIWKEEISDFLANELKLELHPDKSKINPLHRGTTFLGFRVFPKYRLLKKSNTRRIFIRVMRLRKRSDQGIISETQALLSLEGWLAYAKFANTCKLRQRVISTFFQGNPNDTLPKPYSQSILVKEWMSKQEHISYSS